MWNKINKWPNIGLSKICNAVMTQCFIQKNEWNFAMDFINVFSLKYLFCPLLVSLTVKHYSEFIFVSNRSHYEIRFSCKFPKWPEQFAHLALLFYSPLALATALWLSWTGLTIFIHSISSFWKLILCCWWL